MPTVITIVNPATDKHYALKIPPVKKDEPKICSIYLLTFSAEQKEIIESFVEKFEMNEEATMTEILGKGKEIINAYQD